MNKPQRLRIGDIIDNGCTGKNNPYRVTIAVGDGYRPHGRVNPGPFVKVLGFNEAKIFQGEFSATTCDDRIKAVGSVLPMLRATVLDHSFSNDPRDAVLREAKKHLCLLLSKGSVLTVLEDNERERARATLTRIRTLLGEENEK